MVDIWTQEMFRPLHDGLFKVLAALPNDGTFDQNKSFERAQEKAQKHNCCYGYDLSSATDRLPIDLQVSILEGIIGEQLASLWKTIIVGRDYFIPNNDHGIPSKNVRYLVGQPMGALSS